VAARREFSVRLELHAPRIAANARPETFKQLITASSLAQFRAALSKSHRPTWIVATGGGQD
jgi:hypothetical protein